MARENMVDAEFLALQQALAGEYSLERELGRGGMGIVYLARDVQLDRLVAIKVLPTHLAERPELRERFLREARTAAGLSHPNIVPIHRVGEAGAFVFFVMAYIDGETLGQRLRTHGPLVPSAAARILREVSWALAYAHGRGVVHRDIKPDNILLERETGRALVMDFGIAQVATAAERSNVASTDPGHVMGTAHFMSPEQAANEPLDGRSDLYALGVVGYLMLSGRLPFQGASVPALLAKHLTEPAPMLADIAPTVPDRLARAIDRCLRKDRDARFASGEALADALERTAVEQRQLPAPLRAWVQLQNPARSVYIVWSGVCSVVAVGEFIDTLSSSFWRAHAGVASAAAVAALPAGLALLPIIPSAIFHLRKTYRVLRAGYSLADLRYALARWRTEREEELAFEVDEHLALPLRALRLVTYASIPAFFGWVLAFHRIGYTPVFARVAVALLALIPATIVTSTALGVPLLPRRITRAMSLGAINSRFWNSRLGAWTAKILAGSHHRAAPDELVARPTELALGLAASELFAALPTAYREQLHELPDVVHRLETHATTMRQRVEEMAGLAERTGLDELHASHERAKRELAQTVATLESIRLDLLRLHGGATDLEPLTTVLDAARVIGEDLDALIEAQLQVRDDVLPLPRLDTRLRTPA